MWRVTGDGWRSDEWRVTERRSDGVRKWRKWRKHRWKIWEGWNEIWIKWQRDGVEYGSWHCAEMFSCSREIVVVAIVCYQVYIFLQIYGCYRSESLSVTIKSYFETHYLPFLHHLKKCCLRKKLLIIFKLGVHCCHHFGSSWTRSMTVGVNMDVVVASRSS